MEMENWLKGQIQDLKEKNLFRKTRVRSEMPFLQFCANDYLGLSRHHALIEAGKRAIEEFGTGSGSSRLLAGTFPVHDQLEKKVAQWYEKEGTVLFNSGYHAGIGLLPPLSKNGAIFSDEFNHASLIDGCRLSSAKVLVYRHNDMEHLEHLLKSHHDFFPRWIVTESIFSMEGEKAPLAPLAQLKKKYGAWLFLDEAHAIGVYGKKGRGLAEELGLLSEIDLILGTFGKALGSFGAFAAGSKNMVEFIASTARSFIFTTALPPAVAAVNLEAIGILQEMGKERVELRETAKRVRTHLEQLGFFVRGEDSPIVPVILGEPEKALNFSEMLLDQGIWVAAIRPPTVPEGTSRLRIGLSASHTKEDCDMLMSGFKKIMAGVS